MTTPFDFTPEHIAALACTDAARVLAENIGTGDLTAGLIGAGVRATARVLVRQSAVLGGRAWAEAALFSARPAGRRRLAGRRRRTLRRRAGGAGSAGPGQGRALGRAHQSDSLEMARFGRDHPAQTLVVSGARFMGETAKILSPAKQLLMPDLNATCSLDPACPVDAFNAFCDQHPDRTVLEYANTSAAAKARADWVVTSSCALDIVRALKDSGRKTLWAPDRHLGGYLQRETGPNDVQLHAALGLRARLPIDRMLEFTAAQRRGLPTAGLVPHWGAA